MKVEESAVHLQEGIVVQQLQLSTAQRRGTEQFPVLLGSELRGQGYESQALSHRMQHLMSVVGFISPAGHL